MVKKRIVRSKNAQITIFMIVGLVILFAFIFLFQLVNSVQKEKLSSEQEKVFTKAFKKEAMRIYVQDCLSDELEEALIQLGQQGRIWSDQPGGIKDFSEGINGLENPPGMGERIAYGLAKTKDLPFDNAYPCNNQTNSSPEFCQYQFPENKDGFGELDIKTSTIRNDLRRVLINKTIWCITNYTKTNISNKADIIIEDLNLGLDIQNDGISITADFPLKFSIGEEEFFHLSQFDFFYPTQFKWLLEAAIVRPLFYDWKYLDFNYSEGTLKNSTFEYASTSDSCIDGICTGTLFYDKYASLGITLTKEETENGDDILVFSSPEIINKPGFYEFKLARQNRPPALDYINRAQCLNSGYDYLIIPGDEELGDMNITLFALDPDEDSVNKSFLDYKCGDEPDFLNFVWGSPTASQPSTNLQVEGSSFYINHSDMENNPPQWCTLTSAAVDEHGEKDWQDTRILIDRPMTLNLSLNFPYEGISSFSQGYYFVSQEDPIFINLTSPKESLIVGIDDIQANLIYSNFEKSEEFNYSLPKLSLLEDNGCFNFPWTDIYGCSIEDYKNDINDWNKSMNRPYSDFQEKTFGGILNLTFSADYCNELTKENSVSANIAVVQCVPYKDPTRPFAYNPTGNYDQYIYGLTAEGETNYSDFQGISPDPLNPFLATHSCCSGTLDAPGGWHNKDEGTPCFTNPEPDCFGRTDVTLSYNPDPFDVSSFGGYVLEVQKDTCTGDRGNVCGSGGDETKIYNLYPEEEQRMICGNPGQGNCDNDIDNVCKGKDSWSYVDTNNDLETDTWCHGAMGCADSCRTTVVAESTSMNYELHRRDKIFGQFATTDLEFNVHCGCQTSNPQGLSDYGNACDNDMDGIFEGTCSKTGEEGLVCIS